MVGKVFIVSAPSGAGKTTLVNALLARFDAFEFSVSATTRAPRSYEVEGKHYYFLDSDTFQQKIKAEEFLEWEEVYPGKFYGTLLSEVDRILAMGKFPIFDVDVEGGLRIKKHYGPAAIAFFIQPPTPEVLLERLKKRASDHASDIRRRYEKAKHELSYADQFDHIIINDDLNTAIEEMVKIVQSCPGLAPSNPYSES